ncbi:uncharacterized protein LOC106464843 isoform X2 [Limulus polyphemus]|uniref:Uncharacterized protein LOC106464843 isoform X2 n=1 Tax=Limulus polyphemus TaxID=6850 RepID=A0ABM1SXJ2_LIMPO|nr:uncharacterized protein LOC106464843 isoform X2 [Limulus polyphemus]
MYYPSFYSSTQPFEASLASTGRPFEVPRLPPRRQSEIPLDLSNKSVGQTPEGAVETEEMYFLEQRKFAGLSASQGLPTGLHRHMTGVGGSPGTLLDPALFRVGYRPDASVGGLLGANISSPFCVERTPVSSSVPSFGSHHMIGSIFQQRDQCLDQHGAICAGTRPPTHLSPFLEPASLSLPLRPSNSSLSDRNLSLGPRSLYGQTIPSSLGLPSLSLFPERTEEKGAFVALRPGAEKSVLSGTPLEATSYAEHLQRLREHHVQQNKCVGACCSSTLGSLGQPSNSCSCCSSQQTPLCSRGPMACLSKEHGSGKMCNGACGYFAPSLSYLGQRDIRLTMNPYYSNLGEPVRRDDIFGSLFSSNPNLWGSSLSAAPISKAVAPAASPGHKKKDSTGLGQKESPRVAKDFPGCLTPTERRDGVVMQRPLPTPSYNLESLKKESNNNEVIIIEDKPTSKCTKHNFFKPNSQSSDHRTKNRENHQKEFSKQHSVRDAATHSAKHSSKRLDHTETNVKMPQLEAVTRCHNRPEVSQSHEMKFSDPPALAASGVITESSQPNITSSSYPTLWTPHETITSSSSFITSTPTPVTAPIFHQSFESSLKKHEKIREGECKSVMNHHINQNVASLLPYSIINLTQDTKPSALDSERAKEPGCSLAIPSSHQHTGPSHFQQTKQVDIKSQDTGSSFLSPTKEHKKPDILPPKPSESYDPYSFTQEKSEYTFDDSEGTSLLDVGGLNTSRKRSMLESLANSDAQKKKRPNSSDPFIDASKHKKVERPLQTTSTQSSETTPSTSQGCKEKFLINKLKSAEFEEGFRREAKRVCAKAKKKLRKRLLARLYEEQRKSDPESDNEVLSKTELDENSQCSNQVVSQLSLIWKHRRLLYSCQTVRRRRLKSGLDMIAKPHRKKKSKSANIQKLLDKELLKEQEDLIPLESTLKDIGERHQVPFDFSNGAPPEMKRIMVNKALGETILHRAARLGYAEVVLYCLETNYCDVNARDNAGYTPLHESCSRGNLEIASALVQYGADVSASAAGGIRPLHDAVENEYIEIVRLLLSHGADPTIATYSGLTPLKLARSSIMAEFLRGFLADATGETDNNLVLPWKFHGSSCCLDTEETGYDVWEGLPLDSENESEENDDFLFEVSDTPHLPTFRLQLPGNNSKAICNCLRLADVLNQINYTKEKFKFVHSYIEIFPVPKHEIETSATCSQLLTGTRLDSLLEDVATDGSTTIDVVQLDNNIRDILGIETVTLR